MDTIVEDFHGTSVADPYRWLEGRGDAEVDAWVALQNQCTEEFLQGVDRKFIRERLTELWNYPRLSIPTKAGSWYFYQENSGLQNQPVLHRQQGLDGKKEVVLDPNLWSTDGTVALSNYSVDEKARYLAYSISAHGSDRQEIRIRDLELKENLPDVVQWCKFTNLAWLGDQGFYYSRYPQPGSVPEEDENNYNQVYFHRLGTPQSEDILIYERPDAKELRFSPSLSADQDYLILHVFKGTDSRNGFYYQKLGEDTAFTQLLDEGEAKFAYLGNEGSSAYFFTDLNAPKGRIISIDLQKPAREHWLEILSEQDDVIDQVRYVNGHFVIGFMHKAHSILRIYGRDGELLKALPLPAMGSIEGIMARQKQTEFFIGFTSFLYPSVNLHYNFHTGELQFFAKPKLNFNPEEYETSQVFYPSQDGTLISMYLVHRRDLKRTGSNPTLLYGYGGFNISITPTFSASRLFWLEQGGVYAVVNLRGGSEYGEDWHQAGMLGNKQNVFDDFMAAAKWLVAEGYTTSEKLAIEGRSNGGLLVSACMVQRPELFGAVICGVPVTDMLRYHKFTVGRYWVPEYGNAEENPEHFAFMYRYSPLHNVQERTYPPTLVVTADGDDRVVPSHAYKFTATLQREQQGENPILLRVDTKSGHGHGKPISKIIEEHTDVYGFLAKIFKMQSFLP